MGDTREPLLQGFADPLFVDIGGRIGSAPRLHEFLTLRAQRFHAEPRVLEAAV